MKNSDFRVSSYLCECKQNKRTTGKGGKTSKKNIICICTNKIPQLKVKKKILQEE